MTWSGLCQGVGTEPWVMDGGCGLVGAALVCVCARMRVRDYVSLQPVGCYSPIGRNNAARGFQRMSRAGAPQREGVGLREWTG